MDTKNYVSIMVQSLEKKIDVLKKIQEASKVQMELLKQEDVDLEVWNDQTEQKGALIEELLALDEGFEQLYQRVREELDSDREAYQIEIVKMQTCIREITELSVDIQALEARNKELAQVQFSRMKKKTKTMIQSNKVATMYSNSMKKINLVDPQFLDRKK